ncbi:MAG: tetratricopeptide repeat protein [Candidatus Omnitrophota bacterium]|nr:tetratricopeptide repeat protein [Candidatus Omnitrophota bacterium]
MALFVSSAAALDIKEDTKGLSHYIMGLYCEDLGDIDRAIEEYQKALKADPQSSLLHLNLASVFIKKNDALSAIDQLKQSIGLAPDAVEPHAILALVYAAQDKPDLAAQEYTLALKNAAKLEPKNIEIYKNLGAIYLQQEKLKEAESIFKLITGLAPADAQAHFYLGSIYYDSKDYIAAEKEFKAALKLKPDYHEALNFLGYFYLEQDKQINRAGELIRKALSLAPDNGAYIDSLGWFYFKKGRFKEALSELEKAASFLSDPVIYEHLGDVYLKLGNRDSARLNWDKSLKLDPNQEKVKEKLFKVTNNGK